MNYYRLKFENGECQFVKAKTTLELIKKYDLCTKEHVNTRITQLEGEMESIAMCNEI